MNSKSSDEAYMNLISNLREKLSQLAYRIEPKVYEYGFLKQQTFFSREPPGGPEGVRSTEPKHERTVLRSKNKGTKCTFVVSEPQHQLWV